MDSDKLCLDLVLSRIPVAFVCKRCGHGYITRKYETGITMYTADMSDWEHMTHISTCPKCGYFVRSYSHNKEV